LNRFLFLCRHKNGRADVEELCQFAGERGADFLLGGKDDGFWKVVNGTFYPLPAG
jgi:hypothetical protein